MAIQYDKSHHDHGLKPGDKVYIENRSSFKIPGLLSSKLSAKRFGPFMIKAAVGKNAFRLDLPVSFRIHDVISQRHLTRAIPDTWNRVPIPPPPIVVDDDGLTGEFEVEKVLDARVTKRGDKSYLVKWIGYPLHESTWISERDADGFKELIEEFHSTRKTQKKSRRN